MTCILYSMFFRQDPMPFCQSRANRHKYVGVERNATKKTKTTKNPDRTTPSFCTHSATEMNKRALLDRFLPLPEPRIRKGLMVTNNPHHTPCAPGLAIGPQAITRLDYDGDSVLDRVAEWFSINFASYAVEHERALWEEKCERYWHASAAADRDLFPIHMENIRGRRRLPEIYRDR
ncbi:hypothetical protein TW95_gp0497 [Pandoravirus inopinatum]|uniref:Uncharacterized protein n=1 Tax=Pandoravirus inopinatum TaxID=1605721 RepID=A0A0B5J8W7_9VIRU|nr:hypothetical protein TW95_gp0497 [Pandoravirus inopinatum]AJF97231.1 hypothetical protein [Pandoravirus inopinatum]